MREEYETIRTGLLALMCVGDKIHYIIYDHARQSKMLIQSWFIERIEGDMLALKDSIGFTHAIHTRAIEQHNGELYVWQDMVYSYPFRSNKRIMRMIKMIEWLE
jgi:hypothetical protein